MSPQNSTKNVDRAVPRISLRNFDNRITDITAQVVAAAKDHGFFILVDHHISQSAIDAQFAAARSFFELDGTVKGCTLFDCDADCSNHTESYQMQFSEVHLHGFEQSSLFMHACHELCRKLMVCLASGLGIDPSIFLKAHDITKPNIQSVLRAVHYFSQDSDAMKPVPHADWSFLTLQFLPVQSSLEICPGRQAVTDFGHGDDWTRIVPAAGEIVCNVGDLLMLWSDDRYKSTLHRVTTQHDDYSLAYVCQPNSDCVVQGPAQKYPRVTGGAFAQLAMERHAQQQRESERLSSLPSVAFQAATAFAPYGGSMDSGDAAAASSAFAMAASVASTSSMTTSIM